MYTPGCTFWPLKSPCQPSEASPAGKLLRSNINSPQRLYTRSHLILTYSSTDGQAKLISPSNVFCNEFGWEPEEFARPGFWLERIAESDQEHYLDALTRAAREGSGTS